MIPYKKLRKKAKNRRKERILLIAYSVVVTCALVVSIYNNNNVNASVMNISPKDYLNVEENSVTIGAQMPILGDDDSTEVVDSDIDSVFDVASQTSEINTEQLEVEVKKGDAFIGILTGLGLEYKKANDIYLEFKKVYDVRNLRAGQKLQIVTLKDMIEEKLININKIIIEPTVGTRYILERDDNDVYAARKEQDEFETKIKRVAGTIEGTVSSSMRNAGVASRVTADFTNIFGFSVDFSRDVRAGDKFEVAYETKVAPDGEVVQNGEIVFASLTLGKDVMSLYRFEDSNGKVDYYNQKGQALKKTLDRKPLSLKRARISSRFGRRRHPILKDMRMHSGVDYAAPTGTLVYAAGDGVVQVAKYNGGYGNFVKIRHNSEYSTGYGHMKGYAKGIRPGVRVKQGQVIGYVGSTGRSTGPHLHYEVIKNGRKVDPLKIKAATGENLYGKNLQNFKQSMAKIEQSINPPKEPIVSAETEVAAQPENVAN